jgi:phage-related protein (TIGR01555 family)
MEAGRVNRKANRAADRNETIKRAAAAKPAKGDNPAIIAAKAFGLQDSAVAMDAFTNMAARIGYGTPSVAEGADYQMVRWSNDYWLMLTLFRNHWLCRRIVEMPVRDMIKAWPNLISGLSPEDIAQMARTIKRTRTRKSVGEAMKWAGLFGGGGALMIIDGHEDIFDQPLELGDVELGSYKGTIPFDRWSGIFPEDEICHDFNRPLEFNLPEFYRVKADNGEGFRVHASRVLRFIGQDLPYPEFQASMRWGASDLEVVFETIRKYDNASFTILNLLFRAQIVGMKDEDLASKLSGASMNANSLQQYGRRLQLQNELMSNQSLMVVGQDGEIFNNTFSFGGLSDVYQQFQLDVAGAAREPVSRLFGRTISGLGQSNDADEAVYEERIQMDQDEKLDPQLSKLYPVIMMSEFGEVDDSYELKYPSIRVLNEKEKAEMAKDGGELISTTFGAGLLTKPEARTELRNLGGQTGMFTNLDEANDGADEFAEADMPGEGAGDEDGGKDTD